MKKYNIVLKSVKTFADEKIKARRGGSDNKLLKKFKRRDSVLLIPRAAISVSHSISLTVLAEMEPERL